MKRKLEAAISGLSDREAKKLLLQAAISNKSLQKKVYKACKEEVPDPDWEDFAKELPEYINMIDSKPAELQAKMYEKIWENVIMEESHPLYTQLEQAKK